MAEAPWKVINYETERGRQPVRQFLEELAYKKHRKNDALRILEKFDYLEDLGLKGALDCDLIDDKVRGTDKIFEFKLWGTQIRVLLFLWRHSSGQRCMVMASAEVKDGDKLSRQTIRRAEEAREDWVERHI